MFYFSYFAVSVTVLVNLKTPEVSPKYKDRDEVHGEKELRS